MATSDMTMIMGSYFSSRNLSSHKVKHRVSSSALIMDKMVSGGSKENAHGQRAVVVGYIAARVAAKYSLALL